MAEMISEAELRACVDLETAALEAIEDGFRRLAHGQVTIPPIMGLEIPEKNGAADVKAAYVDGWDQFVIKLSTRFFDNPRHGLPSAGGMMAVFDSDTGQIRAVLLDNGYLTTVRTALAGALAARYLAPRDVDTVAVLGAGSQARWQIRALRLVRGFRRVVCHARSQIRAQRFADEMATSLGTTVETADSVQDAVADADVIITTTPATTPLLRAEWLCQGTHVTAMGADAGHKNELEPRVLAAADLLVCDVRSQCLARGELRHAVAAGLVEADRDTVELGDIVVGNHPGRENDRQITVCDLTGVGVQDTAIARFALKRLGHTWCRESN